MLIGGSLLIAPGIIAQSNAELSVISNRISELQSLVLENSRLLGELQDVWRDLSDQRDLQRRSGEDQKLLIEELSKRILLLETTLLELEAKLLQQSGQSLSDSSLPASPPALKSAGQDNRFLPLFDEKDQNLSEQNLFQFAQNLRYTGRFDKARAYLEVYRQKYPDGRRFEASLYLSGLSASAMQDFASCVSFLDEYTKNAIGEDLQLAEWELANCLEADGREALAQSLLRSIAQDQNHIYQAEAVVKLNN